MCGGLSSGLTDANDECTPGGVDHIVGDYGQIVDPEKSLDLQEQFAQKSEVASCNPGDARNRLSVGEVRPVELQAQLLPVPREHKGQFVPKKWTVMMGESDPAVELRVARHALLNSGHADQDEADVVAVEEVTQVFQSGGIEALRFVKDDQFHVIPRQSASCFARMLVDADVDAAEQMIDPMSAR